MSIIGIPGKPTTARNRGSIFGIPGQPPAVTADSPSRPNGLINRAYFFLVFFRSRIASSTDVVLRGFGRRCRATNSVTARATRIPLPQISSVTGESVMTACGRPCSSVRNACKTRRLTAATATGTKTMSHHLKALRAKWQVRRMDCQRLRQMIRTGVARNLEMPPKNDPPAALGGRSWLGGSGAGSGGAFIVNPSCDVCTATVRRERRTPDRKSTGSRGELGPGASANNVT
jgi:hypothetical protein